MENLKVVVEKRIAELELEYKKAYKEVGRQDVYVESRRTASEHCWKIRGALHELKLILIHINGAVK